MPRGRRPEPPEKKRAKGRTPDTDSGGRKITSPANVVSLPGTGDAIPATPPSLVDDGPGERRWVRMWQEASGWLSHGVDYHILVRLCEAEDLRSGMRDALSEEGFYVAGSQGQKRPNPLLDKLRALDDQITKYESLCGLTPSDRGRVGAEVGGPGVGGPSALNAILTQAATKQAGRRSG